MRHAVIALVAVALQAGSPGLAAEPGPSPPVVKGVTFPPAPPVKPALPPEVTAPEAVPSVAFDACIAELRAYDVDVMAMDAASRDGCRLQGAVTLRSIGSRHGTIEVGGSPVMLCGFALMFSAWVRDVAAPLAASQMSSPLVRIETGSGFECRNRYGRADTKVSEHAKGNALDIAALVLGNRQRVEIGQTHDAASAVAGFLRGLRMSACGYFTTVLGPGSNAAHADHLHVDLALHGRSSNYRICE